MSEIQTISVVVAATSVVAFVVNSLLTSRREEKRSQQTLETRQAQLFMEINQIAQSPDFLDSQSKMFGIELRGSRDFHEITSNNEKYRAFNVVALYLEGVGVLVREGLIDIRIVAELKSGFIRWWWDRYGPGVIKCREEMNFPRYMVETEFLANRVSDYGREHPELGIVSPPLT